MSYSSLWVMDKNFNGSESVEFRNSWWFSPIIWDVLLEKYMHNEIQTPYGYKKTFMTEPNILNDLNKIINDCNSITDRICWELTMQQVFHTKDKEYVIKAIESFLVDNVEYGVDETDDFSVLKAEHIMGRFEEIANQISNLDGEEYPYFIFKNTSVDDNVERLFETYEEELDEYINCPLSDVDGVELEFVEISDGKIKFVDNVTYTTDR